MHFDSNLVDLSVWRERAARHRVITDRLPEMFHRTVRVTLNSREHLAGLEPANAEEELLVLELIVRNRAEADLASLLREAGNCHADPGTPPRNANNRLIARTRATLRKVRGIPAPTSARPRPPAREAQPRV